VKKQYLQGDLMSLIVRSKVKSTIKGMRFAGDFYNALDKKVEAYLRDAAKRAKDNGRATIRPCDL
jgi:histone H3/H4